MDNPFLQDSLSFKTEKDMKAGMNNDGLMEAANNAPLNENPFMTGGPKTSAPLANPFLKQSDPYEDMVQFGMKQALDVTQAAVQPADSKLKQLYEGWRSAAKTTSGAIGEAGSMVGSVFPMAMYYLAYGKYREDGASEEQAHKEATRVSEGLDPSEGLGQIADLMGVDRGWVQSQKFKELMGEVDEKIIQPSRDAYGNTDFQKHLVGDIAMVAPFGAAGVLHGKVKGALTRDTPADPSMAVTLKNLKSKAYNPETSYPPIRPEFDTGPTLPEGKPYVDPTAQPEVTYPRINDEFRQPEGVAVPDDGGPLPKITQDQGPLQAPDAPYREPVNDSKFPILQDEPKPFMDQLGPDVDARNTMNNPFIQNKVDLETAQQAPDIGAHSELKYQVEPQDPTLGPPGTRSFDGGVMQDIENKRFNPITTDEMPTNTHYASGFGARDTLWKNTDFVMEMKNADTTGKALSAVRKYGDAKWRGLIDKLMPHTKDIPFAQDALPEGKLGSYNKYYHEIIVQSIEHSLDHDIEHGLHPEVILHEAAHGATVHAYTVGTDPYLKDSPKYANQKRFAEEVDSIYDLTKKALGDKYPKLFESGGPMENAKEMLAYGWTNEKFQRILKDTYIPETKTTFWERFTNAVKRLLGVDKNAGMASALDKVMGTQEHLPFIQNIAKGDIEATVTKLYGHALKDNVSYIKAEELPPDINPDWTAQEAFDRAEKDLGIEIPQNLITPNQITAASRNPLFGWFMAKMDQIVRQASPRFYDYADQLKPYMFDGKTKLERPAILKVFKGLVDLQSPEFYEARKHAEATNTREDLLKSFGLDGQELKFAITVLDIMKDVHTRDIESTKRLGREFDYQPMYFPRMHGGKFLVKVRDAQGVEQLVKGFDSYREARLYEADLRNGLRDNPDGLQVVNTERAEHQGFGDQFTLMLMENQIPMEFLNKVMKTIEKKRETAPFSFEKARRETDVGGYIGEELGSKAEEERLLKVLSWRLLSSKNLETKSRILSEIKFPLFDAPLLGEMPRLRMTMGNYINRALSIDISQTKGIDHVIQRATEIAAKVAELSNPAKGYDVRWGDPVVGNDAARNMVRAWTYITSFFKLTWNAPVLITNAAQPVLLGMDGVRTAALEGLPHGHAHASLLDSLTYFGQDGGIKDFMNEARREGMFEAKGHEHYTTASLPDRGGVDKAFNYPRDKIEQATNYAAILYYYNFFKRARPDLSGEALKAKVYHYAKSFTGQYDDYGAPLVFDKAGTVGQSTTNFSKWHFNQLGRLITDVKEAGAGRSAVPVVMTGFMTLLTAGAYGLPVVVEYEAVRRLGSSLGLWDIPPISSLRSKVSKDYIPSWEFLERGAITAASDGIAKLLGADSGPDVSGSMRYSSFLDVPTVAIQQFVDLVGKLIPAEMRDLKRYLTHTGGNTPKQTEDAVNAVPPALKGIVKHYNPQFKQKMVVNGKTMWRTMDPSEGKQLYSLSDVEETYNLLGMKGKKEVKSLEAIYYEKWLERENDRDMKEFRGQIMGNPADKELFKNNMKEILKLGGRKAGLDTINQMKERITASQLNYFTAAYEKLAKETDGVSKQQQLNRIRKAQRLAE